MALVEMVGEGRKSALTGEMVRGMSSAPPAIPWRNLTAGGSGPQTGALVHLRYRDFRSHALMAGQPQSGTTTLAQWIVAQLTGRGSVSVFDNENEYDSLITEPGDWHLMPFRH